MSRNTVKIKMKTIKNMTWFIMENNIKKSNFSPIDNFQEKIIYVYKNFNDYPTTGIYN